MRIPSIDACGRTPDRLVRALSIAALLILPALPLAAQGSLALSSGTAPAGGSALLALTLTAPAGAQPVAIQWTLTYSPGDVAAIGASAGAGATGKSLNCAGSAGSYVCLLAGMNAAAIQNGVVTTVNVTLASGVASAAIGVTNTMGASSAADALALTGSGGVVTAVAPLPSTIGGLSCAPASLSGGGAATCTVSLNAPAPVGGVVVSLSDDAAPLTVPASVTVGAGSAAATFAATAGTIASDQTATVTAAINGSTKTATIALAAPVALSGLTCAPASLGSGASATCTVTVSKTGGATVTVSSSTGLLTAPASVTVGASSTTATFTATAGTIASDQTATVTAALNGNPKTATIALAAPVALSGLTCAPASLGSGASATCTVTVSKTGGATVTVSSNTGLLTAPASVTVGASSTTATFTATAGTIASDQTATVTAALNGNPKTATIALASQVALSGLTCAPTSLGSGASATCTVTVSKTGGATVTVSSNTGLLTAPASVTVGASSTTATFTATAGTIASDQTATVTAALNGNPKTATIALASQVALSGLTCAPLSLGSGASATCTVTVSKTGGATVTVSSNSALLTAPASVTVGADGRIATFTITAGAIAKNLTATIAAKLGNVTLTVGVALTAPVSVSLTPTSTTLRSSGVQRFVAMVANASNASVVWSISPNTGSISSTGLYTAPNPVKTTLTVTVSATSVADPTKSATARVALQPTNVSRNGRTASRLIESGPAGVRAAGTAQLAGLSCGPDPEGASALACTVQLGQAAPEGGATVSLRSNSARVRIPGSLTIPAGSEAAAFLAGVVASDEDARPEISATFEGTTKTASVAIPGIRPTSVTCAAATIQAGNWLSCKVELSPGAPAAVRLAVSTDNPDLAVPAAIATRPGQTALGFQLYANPRAARRSSNVSVQFGGTAVSCAVSVTPAGAPVLSMPGDVETAHGKAVNFTFSAADPMGLAILLSASGLPGGAVFDPATGGFSWTPLPSQAGIFEIALTATNSASASATGRVRITVDAGKPVITGIHSAAGGSGEACSPGAAASLAGRWLARVDGAVAEPSGSVTELGGTRVKVNGEYVPVIYASPVRVDFVCPNAAAGTVLTVSAENPLGAAEPVRTTMLEATPGIYTMDGSGAGPGAIRLAGTSLLAVSRDYRELGQPAEPGDYIAIRATGLGSVDRGGIPAVTIGGIDALVRSVRTMSGSAGVYEIIAEVPVGVQAGDAVPVVLRTFSGQPATRASSPAGAPVSNAVTIAIERPRP